MAIKKYKPTTSSRRYITGLGKEEITVDKPYKPLCEKIKNHSGRNNKGRITSRHRGGGSKKIYRKIDFRRNKIGLEGIVETIEYDPNRTSNIALVKYKDGERRYILAPVGLKVGNKIISNDVTPIKNGNCLKIKNIPLGTTIHNIELTPGNGGKIARSAGTYAELVAKEGKYAHLRMPSKEVRLVLVECRATIGQIGNLEQGNITIGKAGRQRWRGRRPHVRGVVMNPIDHPLGGGEGRSSGGRHPCSPWGQPTKGKKTRRKKVSDKLIVKRRPKKRK